jgi:hypothetical protein
MQIIGFALRTFSSFQVLYKRFYVLSLLLPSLPSSLPSRVPVFPPSCLPLLPLQLQVPLHRLPLLRYPLWLQLFHRSPLPRLTISPLPSPVPKSEVPWHQLVSIPKSPFPFIPTSPSPPQFTSSTGTLRSLTRSPSLLASPSCCSNTSGTL